MILGWQVCHQEIRNERIFMDKPIRVYQCEDSTDGILSAVYDAGLSGYGHDFIRIQPIVENRIENYELFTEYVQVQTDPKKTANVIEAVKDKISREAYSFMMSAVISEYPDRGDAIYQFVTYGFTMGAKVCSALQIPCVKRIFAMNRAVQNETRFFREFLRFQEVQREPSLLLAVIEPKNRIIPFLTEHFADRFMGEWFVIYDKTHREASFHQKDGNWEVRLLTEEEVRKLEKLTEQKEEYADLWKTFFHQIAIAERTNKKLQRNMLPLHYRKHMTEFQE